MKKYYLEISGRIKAYLKTVYEKTFFCIVERRLPFRKIRPEDMVEQSWYNILEHGLATTLKVKVGFGPVFSGENDLHVRKWRIDPIVDQINRVSDKYCAGIYLSPKEMDRFDIVVVVREIDGIDCSRITELRQRGTIFIFDIVDRPYLNGDEMSRVMTSEFIRCMDGLIASNPLQVKDLKALGKKTVLIEHPVLNTVKKDYSKSDNRELKVKFSEKCSTADAVTVT
jgi:hypothetical protein